MVSAYLTCFGCRFFSAFSRQHLRQNQQIVQRRPQLVAHVGEEFALVLRSQRKLFGLFFERRLGLLDFAVLGFDFGLLFGQQLRFFFQFGVGLLQLFGQRLALLQQFLGTHGRGDGIQHDAETLRHLIEKRQMDIAELVERRQFDHRLGFAFEQHRQHHDAGRRGLPRLDVIRI